MFGSTPGGAPTDLAAGKLEGDWDRWKHRQMWAKEGHSDGIGDFTAEMLISSFKYIFNVTVSPR